MGEAGAQARRRCQHQADAGGAPVQIDREMRPQAGERGGTGGENLIDIGIAGKHSGKAVFHHHAEL